MPKVSIGLPVRNGEKYLGAALEAIQNQTFTDFEVLISDNASSDSTPDIAAELCGRDPRFSYHRQQENLGASGNFNYVFQQTSAPLFRWAAYDDLIRPNYLSACVAALDAAPGAVLVFPQTTMIDTEGRELAKYQGGTRDRGSGPSERLDALIGPGDPRTSLLHMCFPVFGLIRRNALQRTGLIANIPRSDTLLLVELALQGPFVELADALFLRREHPDGSVISAEKAARGPELERLLAAWFDPSSGHRFPATVTKLGLGFLRAVARTPMPATERLRCMRVAAGWIARNTRIIGGEMKIVVRERLSSR